MWKILSIFRKKGLFLFSTKHVAYTYVYLICDREIKNDLFGRNFAEHFYLENTRSRWIIRAILSRLISPTLATRRPGEVDDWLLYWLGKNASIRSRCGGDAKLRPNENLPSNIRFLAARHDSYPQMQSLPRSAVLISNESFLYTRILFRRHSFWNLSAEILTLNIRGIL